VTAPRLYGYNKDALTLLGALTFQTFDVYRLAGPANVKVRQMMLHALRGGDEAGKRPTQAESGVNALRAAFHGLYETETGAPVPGDCIAQRDNAFATWAASVLS